MKEVLTQNNSLLSEISRVRISASYPEGQEALRIAVLEEKLAEYQQSSAEIQGQLVDEIRTLETKLSISEKSEKENVLRIEQLENSVEEWRKRFENVSHENETLIRSNEEVKHLELAIRENSEEKEKLYQELAKLMEERRQLTASRDHLSSQLEEAQLEITRLREKTKNNNESRTQNAMKYVALENEVRRLKAELESLSVESAEGAKNSEMDNSKKKKACDEGEVVLLSHNFSSDSSRTRSNLKEHVSISGSQKARNVLHRVGRSLKLLPYRRTSCVPYSYVRFLFLTYIMFIHVAFFFCLYH
ncbi:hypothetical protein AB6A40_006986 [Gnathostoma spinigerum]|uniref:Golgin-84 n=1 Tax=Gnathostoma spinigerum TaxID=75299 RepID=A0ABD6EM49_9BILA